jgi:transketolase
VLASAEQPKVALLSSGSEVALVLQAYEKLIADGVAARVVSMPSMELFDSQPESYRNSVLPAGVPRVAVEAGHPMSWYKWIAGGEILGVTRFGASAPYERIYKELGLTVDRVVEAAKRLVTHS